MEDTQGGNNNNMVMRNMREPEDDRPMPPRPTGRRIVITANPRTRLGDRNNLLRPRLAPLAGRPASRPGRRAQEQRASRPCRDLSASPTAGTIGGSTTTRPLMLMHPSALTQLAVPENGSASSIAAQPHSNGSDQQHLQLIQGLPLVPPTASNSTASAPPHEPLPDV